MKTMRRACLFALAACAAPLLSFKPVLAETAVDMMQCPAPVVEGPWSSTDLPGTVVRAFSPEGSLVLPVPPAPGQQFGTVANESCDATFTLSAVAPDGSRLTWRMEPESWDGEEGPVYSGAISPAAGMTFTMRWTAGNAYEAVGMNEITMLGRGVMATGSPRALLRSLQEPRRRYECRCLGHLKPWIDDAVAEAERFRDAFANPEYAKHPPEVPPDQPGLKTNWTPQVYDDVIYLMVGQRMGYREAVKTVAEAYFPQGSMIELPKDGGDVVDSDTVTAAVTDMGDCTVTYGNAHKSTCYPALTLEATTVHENVHVDTCRKSRLRGVLSVAEHGQDEAKAYQAEIDFLKGFIPTYCQ